MQPLIYVYEEYIMKERSLYDVLLPMSGNLKKYWLYSNGRMRERPGGF